MDKSSEQWEQSTHELPTHGELKEETCQWLELLGARNTEYYCLLVCLSC